MPQWTAAFGKQSKRMKNTKLSVIIPVLNEGINLKFILKIFETALEVSHEMLVVYDQSGDNSIPVAKEMQRANRKIRLVHNKIGKGVINAIKSGVKSASGDYVLIVAADDIGPVLTVEDMVYLMDNGCDFVSATRYAYGGRCLGGVFISRLLSRTANKIFHIISRSAFTDSTLGIKMFRRAVFDKLKLEAKPIGWAVAFEMSIKAQLAGLRLGEVPIISINRFYGGKSSFKLGPWVKEYSKWFFWGFKELHKRGKKDNVHVRIPGKISLNRQK